MSWIHCWLNFLGESVNNWPGKHISMETLQVWIGHTTHLSELISDFHKTELWLNEPSLVLYIFPNQLLDLISSPNAVVLPDNFSLWTGWQMSSGRSLHGLWCLQMTPWSIVSLKMTTWEGQLRLRQGQRRCEMKRGWPEREDMQMIRWGNLQWEQLKEENYSTPVTAVERGGQMVGQIILITIHRIFVELLHPNPTMCCYLKDQDIVLISLYCLSCEDF